MYAFLTGTITYTKKDFIALNVSGIGFKIFTANPYSFNTGETLTIYTHQVVNENEISLYGFKSMEELNLFTSLIAARGIGPKTACAILATGDMQGLATAITDGDALYLTKFPKIGPKTASQIILDLQGKLNISDQPQGIGLFKNTNLDEALEALIALGYSPKELKRVEKTLKNSTEDVNVLIKEALKMMMKG